MAHEARNMEAEAIITQYLRTWSPIQSSHEYHARDLIAALTAAGLVVVPKEPTEAMLDKGEHANSEWLNDNAPIGQRRYREPAKGVYRAMIEAALPPPPAKSEG